MGDFRFCSLLFQFLKALTKPVQSFSSRKRHVRTHPHNCPDSAHGIPKFTLVERMRELAPLEHYTVLLEKTGHYHKAILQFLQELDLPVYVTHVQQRPSAMMKTDKRDALGLANTLYNQLALGIQVADKTQLVRKAFPPSATAAQLKGLIRHRYELVREATQRKNKLIAICDEIFPELTQVLKDPTLPTALAIRERFPTPHTLATASLSALAVGERENAISLGCETACPPALGRHQHRNQRYAAAARSADRANSASSRTSPLAGTYGPVRDRDHRNP